MNQNTYFLEYDLVRLDVGPCYGPCPIYKVEIKKNGEVTFWGERFVPKPGVHQWIIPQDQLKYLRVCLRMIKEFKLQPEGWITDKSKHTLELIKGDDILVITLDDEYGGNVEQFEQLLQDFKNLAGLRKYIEVEDNSEREW